MAADMKENVLQINLMEKEFIDRLMETGSRVPSRTEKNMAKGSSYAKMAKEWRGIFQMMSFLGLEF